MTQELTQQWLTEIKTLKQQVAELQAEKDAGWESAQKWRHLYNTEAEQRRTDAQMFHQQIASLKAKIQELTGYETKWLNEATTGDAIQQEIAQLQSVEELTTKLIAVMQQRDRLQQALQTEQDHHAQTRKSLTAALGDAIDSLTRQKQG